MFVCNKSRGDRLDIFRCGLVCHRAVHQILYSHATPDVRPTASRNVETAAKQLLGQEDLGEVDQLMRSWVASSLARKCWLGPNPDAARCGVDVPQAHAEEIKHLRDNCVSTPEC